MKDLVNRDVAENAQDREGSGIRAPPARRSTGTVRREEERGLWGCVSIRGVSLSHRHGHSRQTLPGPFARRGLFKGSTWHAVTSS